MITCHQQRFLDLLHPQSVNGLCGIVILIHITRLGVVVTRLEVRAVLRGELMLERQVQEELAIISVCLLSGVGTIARVERVTGVPPGTELRSQLLPRAATEIL